MKTTVVHCKREKYDMYIGRPSKWGNPFMMGIDGDRLEVIDKYRKWLMKDKSLVDEAKEELTGKILGCWCKPKPCHGDVLADICNAAVAP